MKMYRAFPSPISPLLCHPAFLFAQNSLRIVKSSLANNYPIRNIYQASVVLYDYISSTNTIFV